MRRRLDVLFSLCLFLFSASAQEKCADFDEPVSAALSFLDGSKAVRSQGRLVEMRQREDDILMSVEVPASECDNWNRTIVTQTSQGNLLFLHHAPLAYVDGAQSTVESGARDVTIICNVVAQPSEVTEVRWFKNGRETFTNLPRKFRVTLGQTPTLTFVSVADDDDGIWQCRARNTVGFGPLSLPFTLTVTPRPIVAFAPRITRRLSNGDTVEENSEVIYTVPCEFEASPDVLLEVEWRKDNRKLVTKMSPLFSGGTTTSPSLKIHGIDDGVAGSYVCRLRNAVGFGSFSPAFVLRVVSPLSCAGGDIQRMTVTTSGTEDLRCEITGGMSPDLPATFEWLRNGQRVSNFRSSGPRTSILTVRTARREQLGDYDCIATVMDPLPKQINCQFILSDDDQIDEQFCPDFEEVKSSTRRVVRSIPPRGAFRPHPPNGFFAKNDKLEYECNAFYKFAPLVRFGTLVTSDNGERTCGNVEPTKWAPEAPPTCTPECGRSFASRLNTIIGGNVTNPRQWPWMASIRKGNQFASRHICGGALLGKRLVVTAAHCVTKRPNSNEAINKDRIVVSLGKRRREDQDDDPDTLQTFKVANIIIHFHYDHRNTDSDIAVIFLEDDVEINEFVQPVCLPERDFDPGIEGIVTGWGVTERNTTSDVLLEARLPIIDQVKCQASFDSIPNRAPIQLTPNMMCVGNEDGSGGTCSGDSGGPFVVGTRRQNKIVYRLTGIVSFVTDEGCGLAGRYAVFTRVAQFIDWLALFSIDEF